MDNLKISIFQTDIAWHDRESNLRKIESLLEQVDPATDLVVLPEMFNTGFTMRPGDIAEEIGGPTITSMKKLSVKFNIDITGSIPFTENRGFYNRLIWAKPDGNIFTYDKRHLFRLGGEEKVYTAGSSLLTVELKGWRIRPFICYDLRFPAWTRNTGPAYDVALFVANWPASRIQQWEMLLRGRAIENQCYVAGVNRTGRDGNGLLHNGMSAIIDYRGNTLAQAGDSESVHSVTLSFDDLKEYRESFPFWMDADRFTFNQ